jgi:hypothetical protein
MSSCEKSQNDPCDDTVKSEITVYVQTTIHILNLNEEPIVNEPIRFQIYKIPCGYDSEGIITYNIVTGPNGSWTSPEIGYNLRNSEDKVGCSAVAPDLENYFEKNYDYKEFRYSEFSTLNTKEVHLYIFAAVEEK